MPKIVIDISDRVYNRIQSLEPRKDGVMLLDTLMCAVQDGTPLPEGHGRLIDADAFIKEKTEIFCENCDRRRGMKNGKLTKHFVYDIGDAPCRACDIGDMIDYVDDAPTIIEADVERSE